MWRAVDRGRWRWYDPRLRAADLLGKDRDMRSQGSSMNLRVTLSQPSSPFPERAQLVSPLKEPWRSIMRQGSDKSSHPHVHCHVRAFTRWTNGRSTSRSRLLLTESSASGPSCAVVAVCVVEPLGVEDVCWVGELDSNLCCHGCTSGRWWWKPWRRWTLEELLVVSDYSNSVSCQLGSKKIGSNGRHYYYIGRTMVFVPVMSDPFSFESISWGWLLATCRRRLSDLLCAAMRLRDKPERIKSRWVHINFPHLRRSR